MLASVGCANARARPAIRVPNRREAEATAAVALYAVWLTHLRSSGVGVRDSANRRLVANGQVIVAMRSTGMARGPQSSIAWRVAPSGGGSECLVIYVTTVGAHRPEQIDSREQHKWRSCTNIGTVFSNCRGTRTNGDS